MCVTTTSYCSSTISIVSPNHCLTDKTGALIPCADGRCVASSDQCRPIKKCKSLYHRCNDGSCKIDK